MSVWGAKRQYFGFGWKGPDAPTTFAAAPAPAEHGDAHASAAAAHVDRQPVLPESSKWPGVMLIVIAVPRLDIVIVATPPSYSAAVLVVTIRLIHAVL